MARRTDLARLSVCIAATIGLTSFADATDIYDIQAEPFDGGWDLNQMSYTPSFEGRFGLDTVNLDESAPQAGGDWFDLQITVYRNRTARGLPDQDEMIAVKKLVTNLTDTHWTDFHMEIGTSDGEIYPLPGLIFKRDPSPVEDFDRFESPPMFGSNQNQAPALWWFDDPDGGYPGVAPGDFAQFWLAIVVPGNLFQLLPDSQNGSEYATFILRQHWTPTPGAAGVLALAGAATLRRRRRS